MGWQTLATSATFVRKGKSIRIDVYADDEEMLNFLLSRRGIERKIECALNGGVGGGDLLKSGIAYEIYDEMAHPNSGERKKLLRSMKLK